MRLIEADKLLKQLEWLDIDDFILYEEVKKDIDEMPTAKAIPVEWIRGRLQKAVDFTHNKVEGKFIDNGVVVEVVSASFTANVLLKMLEDWEKENEHK